MKSIVFSFLLLNFFQMNAQFTGQFSGTINGDNVFIDLAQSGNIVNGMMRDSKQTYTVTGSANGNLFNGKAIEASLGLTFVLKGQLNGNSLNLDGDLDLYGNITKAFSAVFSKNGGDNTLDLEEAPVTENNNSSPNTNSSSSATPSEVKNKPIDPQIIGLWREESHYSSGYGENAFHGSSYNFSSFNPDHTISQGGSQTTISGSNYSGNSGQSGLAIVPNIWYYTSGKKVMAYIFNNGQYITVEMGSYYIENGKMLFTQANTGTKLFYTKM
jgi:hypothetical protein